MDITLYRAVGNAKRVALGDLANSEYYSASRAEDGTITLTPVNIVGGATKRAEDDNEGSPETA